MLPKALNTCSKSNKVPNLVTLLKSNLLNKLLLELIWRQPRRPHLKLKSYQLKVSAFFRPLSNQFDLTQKKLRRNEMVLKHSQGSIFFQPSEIFFCWLFSFFWLFRLFPCFWLFFQKRWNEMKYLQMLGYYRALGQNLYQHSEIFRASERNFTGAKLSVHQSEQIFHDP